MTTCELTNGRRHHFAARRCAMPAIGSVEVEPDWDDPEPAHLLYPSSLPPYVPTVRERLWLLIGAVTASALVYLTFRAWFCSRFPEPRPRRRPVDSPPLRPMTSDLYVAASVGPCWAQLRASVPGGVAMPP